jgi:diacylglycerol O-acyltransferase
MTFERRLALRELKRAVNARFLAFARFRQCAVQDRTGAWWQDDAAFDLDRHVHRVKLSAGGGKPALEALVSRLASTPLDFERPLWEFHLVDEYLGGSAVVVRIHHCYADGIALIQVMLSLTHDTAAGSLAHPSARRAPRREAPLDLWDQLLRPLGGAAQLGQGLLQRGLDMAGKPQQAADAVQALARKGVGLASEIAHLALMGSDSPTRFKGALGKRKRAAWAEPLPLEEVKAVGRALGCSINDVLLSMATGALRDYLRGKGERVDGVEIRAIVPVNLRPPCPDIRLGNHFGLVFLELPLGLEHPLERLYEVRRRMARLKGSWQPVIALGLLNAIGAGPRALQDQVTALLGQNASAVVTNVPGPQKPLYFAGRRIRDLDFWVPQSGGIGMGISILSYDGRIHFGIITDAGLVPDPGAIVGRFTAEFEQLMWLTLMSPWGEPLPARP